MERPTLVLGRKRATVSASGDDLALGDEVGSWRLDEKLAEGGMSVVFAAHHRFLERRAAIKVASQRDDASARERFLREAQLLASIDHPGVVEMFDVGVLPDGRPWMAMELLDGSSLAQVLDDTTVEPVQALVWLRQVANTLATAHALGIVHRDVKPDNLFIGVDGRVHLLDWGIALERPRVTEDSLVLGTPEYIAPEQARGLDVDGGADVYALGVVAYELLAHRLPFDDPPSLGTVWPDAPPRLEGLVMSMLAKEPARRPEIDEVERELVTIAAALRRSPVAMPHGDPSGAHGAH
jgi:serine/threonine protein kinase